MDVHPVTQKVQAFHKRHGGECYSDGYYLYYADGAYRDIDPLGVLAEPPETTTAQGEWLRANNKLLFAKAKLQAAVDEFETENERLCNWFARPL